MFRPSYRWFRVHALLQTDTRQPPLFSMGARVVGKLRVALYVGEGALYRVHLPLREDP
jgi:hypothetical protein